MAESAKVEVPYYTVLSKGRDSPEKYAPVAKEMEDRGWNKVLAS